MLNSNRKQRPSFLRPLTPISPLGTSRAENISSGQKENVLMGPTSRGSLPSSVYGVRPRSKSVTGNQTHATSFSAPSAKITRNGASSLGATPSGSARSSRHSSFAAESTRRPSSVRDPTSSRRGSLWSEFGDDAVSGGRELTEEEKALEAQKSFASSAKTLWESGVDRLVVEAWSSFAQGWKSGDIVGLISVDRFNLPRVERARIIVLIDDLELQLQDLATTSLSLPGAIAFLRDPSWVNSAGLIDALLASPNHVYSLLKVLDSAARLWLRAAPSIVDQFSTPRNIEDTLDHSLNLCAFLTGSSTDLRRAFVASLSLLKEFSALLDRASRAAISINSNAPHDVAAFTPSFHASSSSVYLPHYVLGQLDEFTAYIKSLLSQPKTSNSIEVFQAELGSLWSALIGNARVARVARGLERIWENKSTTLREKAVAMLAAADGALKWEIDSVTSETDDFKFTFGSLKPHLSELVPREVAFTYAPIGINARHQSPSSVVLRGLRLAISDATYEITKHGLLGFADSGIASIVVPFELEICFTGDNQNRPKIKLNFYEKQEVTLHSGGKSDPGTLTKVWNSWLSAIVKSKISEAIEERLIKGFEEWIAPLYFEIPFVAAAVPSTGRPLNQGKEVLPTVLPSAVAGSGSAKTPSPLGSGTPLGARAAFLASLRMTSGIDVKPLMTGRDVLDSLENPFGSGPNSAAFPENEDDESDAGGLKSRRMSMAMSLTDVSKSDATNVKNIVNPPRAQSVSHMVVEDAPSSFSTRRLSLAFTPIGEPSLETYDSEFAPSATTEAATPASKFHRSSSVMADSLDARAATDTTTVEGLLIATKESKYGFRDEHYRDERATVSMAQVTRELQAELQESDGGVADPKIGNIPLRRDSDDVPQPVARRKSMSEYLTEAAMVDQTDTTVNPGYRRRTEQADSHDAPNEDNPWMSASLDATASIDTTLPENIAVPPRAHRSSFGPGSHKGRSKSFTELNDVPSMAEIGIDEYIIRDETDPTTSKRSNVANDYPGIDPAELKKRRMSSFMDEISNTDATLLENIQAPPTVDQTYHQAARLPHSLSSRRSSSEVFSS